MTESTFRRFGWLALCALVGLGPPALAQEPGTLIEDEPAIETESEDAPVRETDYYSRRLATLRDELARHRTSPRAAATLYELAELIDRLDSLPPLAQTFSRVSKDQRALPEVRALASYLLSKVELERGRTGRAQEALATLGLARDGWLIGGFDNEGGIGHAQAFAPEQGPIDLTAAHTGKEREVRWRRLPELGPDARVPVFDLLRPRQNATFYFLTSFDSPTAQRALLHLGTSGATKLWVNGHLALDDDAQHPATFDQRAVSVAMRKGANLVLLKVSSLDDPPAFFLRASSTRGPISGRFVAPAVDSTPTAVAEAGAKVPASERPAPVLDVVAQIEKLLERSPLDGQLREDLATVLAHRRPFDSKLQRHRHEQDKAAQLLTRDPSSHLRLAGYITDDHNESRAALEKALEIDPKYAPARTALGTYLLQRGFTRRAHDELRRATRDMPDYYPAALAYAEALQSLGFEARSRREELALADRFPSTPDVVLTAARAERALGRVQDAIHRYRVVLSLRFAQREARSELASLLLDTGRVGDAVTLLERARELSPTSLSAALRLADVLSFNDRPSDALAVYDAATQIAPDDELVFERRGQHRLRAGDRTGALSDFELALSLKPQNPRLRDLVRSVQPEDNFASPYLRDPVLLAREAREKPAPAGEDAVVLANVQVVRVFPNGLSSRVRQEVVQVLTPRGVEGARVRGVTYTPGEHQVKIERARIVKPDGSVIETRNETDRAGNNAYDGMYFDNRQRVVAFPGLEPGDVVEFTWRMDDVSAQNMFADYFGDVEFLQGTHPQRQVEYVLVAPAERHFYANQPALPGIEHTVDASQAGTKVWRWAVRDVPKIEPEPRMPGWASIAAHLHVSTFREWDDVARFWWGLVRDQLHATPAVQQAAEEAVKGIPASDMRGRVRAVYDYVVTKTRYVGLEFGIHGFKPYPVDRVLARRFGDCKDKAALMFSMLRHLGIDSRLVLLRMRHLGHLDERPASLAVFNHAVLYVPELDMYLDGTAEFSGSGELPGSDQGAQVLIVEHDGRTPSRFLTTPVSRPEENRTANRMTVQLARDGSAQIQGETVVEGQTAQSYRRAYQSETGRTERFEQSYSRAYPGVRVSAFEVSDARAIEEPVRMGFRMEAPQLARTASDTLDFSPFGEPFRYVEAFAPLSRRSLVLDLGAPWRNEFHYTVRLPEGATPASLPEPVERTTPFGSFRYQFEQTDEGIVATGHVALAVDRVRPEEYADFRAFLAELDRILSRRLQVTLPAAAAEASR